MDDRIAVLVDAIQDYQDTIGAHTSNIDLLKERVRECRRELAGLRALEKARKRTQSKPAYEAVRVRKDAAQARMNEAMAMRNAGLTFSDIAAAWGISVSRARAIVNHAERIARYRESRENEATS